MASMSKEEYLKKYLSENAETKKKKKRKKTHGAFAKIPKSRIVDDDVDLKSLLPDNLDDIDDNEPTVAEVIDERPEHVKLLEKYRQSSAWKVLSAEDQEKHGKDRNDTDSDQSPPRRKRHDSDSDQSPPRRQRHDSDQSPPRRQRHDSDQSPPRIQRYDSDSDQSPPRRQRHDSDQSPPRRQRHDSDQSPPRRQRHNCDSDQSPPRKPTHRTSSNQSFTRKHRHDSDSDQSPQRRIRHDTDSDQSPPRRKRQHDSDKKFNEPSARRPVHHDTDLSPPRKRKSSPSSVQRRRHDSDSDQSPPRKKSDSRFSPSRRQSAKDSHTSNKTLAGKKAGLSSAKDMRIEAEELKKKEEEKFNSISDDRLGKGATTVFRDKTGKRRNLDEERMKESEEAKKKAKGEEKYQKWGKGLKQLDDHQKALSEALHEADKPLARYKDDQDLDQMMRDMDREEDPMLAFIKKKKKSNVPKASEKPRYKGPAPAPNRFGIMPGYRWDGVDRSNGFERQVFSKQAEKRATEIQAYKWSTEDM